MNQAIPQLHDFLIESAKRLPSKVGLVVGDRRFTYAELDRQSDALARYFESRGVERGDRVAIFGGNSAETVLAFWAVLKANAVVVVINPLTKPDKLDYML